MIQRIIDLSVRHKWIVFLLTAAVSGLGYWCLVTMRLDAMPDLGETQVIVKASWDRSPDLVENQVTYPIVTAMLGAAHVKTVRAISDFGAAYIYVIFEDGTDVGSARSQTLGYLSDVRSHLPEGATVELGPDASSVGWIFQYVLIDTQRKHSLADLRSYQDWYLRSYLKAVRGVADVAPIGGFTRQYQVNLDPGLLQRFGVSITQVVQAVREGNAESSGRLLEFGGSEYMVRGRGLAQSLTDFGDFAVSTPEGGAPIRIRDLGEVVFGPEIRRGVDDLDGNGDVVSGIVIMRNGENALQVIERVKAKLKEIEPGLPEGIKVVPVYDRSLLIHHTVDNAKLTILQILVTVVLVILIFLWHFPSAIIPIVTMPVAILLAFIPLHLMGISLNVMSLAGIAIACGELIDASIVVVEQTHKKLEQWERAGRRGSAQDVVLAAVKQVSGPAFFSLLVIAVSFLPVLSLEAQEGRLFRPLAYAKSMAMLAAALLAITLDPALRIFLSRVKRLESVPGWLARPLNALLTGRVQREEAHPLSRFLIRLYEPVVSWVLTHKALVLGAAVVMMLLTIPAFVSLGSEYLPAMEEEAVLYMPTTMPGISIAEAQRLLQITDSILRQFPEVDHVMGKAGRAESATDPAPLSMLETLVTLKPRVEWRRVDTWYSAWSPEWMRRYLRHVTPDTISEEDLVQEMDAALKVPGVANAWTTPIRGRVDMLTSGIRTPVGLRISGPNARMIEQLGRQVEGLLPAMRGTRGAFAERTSEGSFLDIQWKRDELARYGVSMQNAQSVIAGAIGGEDVTTVINGHERYPVNVRYMRDYRGNVEELRRILVPGSGGRQIPISLLATVETTQGPAMIRDEDGLLTGYVYVDISNRDPGSYIAEAAQLLRARLHVPSGYNTTWGGQYEAMVRVRDRLKIVVPVTLAIVVLLIFLNTRSAAKTMIVLLAVPFSAVGAVWLLYLLHYNMSIAVWVGMLGLMSVDAETGVFMLLYLEMAYEEAKAAGRLRSPEELREVIRYGAARRLRPKVMTFATTCIGLLPILWSVGPGSEVMKRIAAPMVGGILTSFLLELLIYPVIYELWRSRDARRYYDQADQSIYKEELDLALTSAGD